MKLYLLICFLAFSEKLAMCYSSTAGNTFRYVQSGNTTSNSCILDEFPINNQKVSARLQCVMPCTALSQCVGFDIIESISKTCHLLRGFAALYHLTRHQKPLDMRRYMCSNLRSYLLYNCDGYSYCFSDLNS